MPKLNQTGYRWYVVVAGKIASGWEFREDAADDAHDNGPAYLTALGMSGSVAIPHVWCFSACIARGFDPNNNDHWHGALVPAPAVEEMSHAIT